MLKAYLKKIADTYNRGDAREESYYPVFKNLLVEYCNSVNKKSVHVTILPKKTEAGNPDFRIWDGKQHITGYIEAKDPTLDNLDRIEDSEQIKRYLHTFPNLILTNFLEYRLYRNGVLTDNVLIGRPFILHKLKTTPPTEKEPELLQLFEKFFSFSMPKVYDAKSLAIELAKRTRFLKDEVIAQELREEEKAGKGFLRGFYNAFKGYLISSLSEEEFSDLYAQTITYGLFAARTRSGDGFNRKLAYYNIPQTIGILRDVFQFISLGSLPQQMEWIIDDISAILSVTDTNKLLHQYFHEGKGKDPIIHFYETFLSEYDPKTREVRGVYYTPEPVVSYIARSLHDILKEQFKKPLGFADKQVTILDPAAGTLTFLTEAAKLAVDEFITKYGGGGKEEFIRDHLLKNFYALELMMAPYAVGHLKMSYMLEELGYRLQRDDRVKLYLTNTLEMEDFAQTELPGMASLSEESHLAGRVKKEQPILVILGNPPYSISSTNKSNFIEQEMNVYKEDVRSERNIQPLSDDYIKFIRFAHWKIEHDGKGIIGMITNNSYLSGLIHRGMRRKLFEGFDEIYILNLHGNSRIGEKCPDGSKDENVFDIQQGVAIVLFIKKEKRLKACTVYYQDIYGLREDKYRYLNTKSIRNTKWTKLKLSPPYFFFVEKDFSFQVKYNMFTPIPEIFNKSSSGVKTHRDHFVVGFTEEEIKQRMRTFTSNLPDEIVRQGLDLDDSQDFKLKESRNKLKKEDWENSILPYSYRPFDNRYICYRPELIDRDRYDVMRHFCRDNLGLQLKRSRYIKVFEFRHAFAVSSISDLNFFGDQTWTFPLYLYQGEKLSPKRFSRNLMMLFEPAEAYELKKPNLSAEVVDRLSKVFEKTPSPEQIFYGTTPN